MRSYLIVTNVGHWADSHSAHYEEEKVKIQERCSHTMINLAIMWDGKLFQWFASETIFIWFATFDCKPLQSKLGANYKRFNFFPIFFVSSLFWCSFHFPQPCSLQFSLPIVYLFPALWQSLVDNVSRAPPPPINRRLLDEWRKTGTKCGQNCTWSLISNPHPLNITAIIILVIHMALSKWGLTLDPRAAC